MTSPDDPAADWPAVDWPAWAQRRLDGIRASGRWRQTRPFDALGVEGRRDGHRVVSFASNDYLGLSAHPAVVAAAHEAIERWGTGATASRLVVGDRPCHDDLEADLADWKHCDRAVVLATGYAANLGVLTVFGGDDATIFSDELNHASIVDGCRLARSALRVYRHTDIDHLASLLGAAAPDTRRIVVTDSVFSMDGDVAPLYELGELCDRHGALLVLDEAHAVLGPDPAGLVDERRLVRVGTLSKALGSLGGWVAGPVELIELLVNRARPFIFSTAPSPADTAAATAALRIVRSAEGDRLAVRLRSMIDRVRPHHPSPIIPVVLGDEQRAVKAAAALFERGVLIPAIRPPTVPSGTSRLRVTVSAAHTDAMIDRLVDTLDALSLRP